MATSEATLISRAHEKLQGVRHHAKFRLGNSAVDRGGEPAGRVSTEAVRSRGIGPAAALRRHLRGVCLLVLILGAAHPRSALASTEGDSPALPSLVAFIASVQNGNAAQLRGVYAEGLFALPVTQQPGSQPYFVSHADRILTQFTAASSFGNVGLLAHNYLSGQYFFRLKHGQKIYLVYGDGHFATYVVVQLSEYRAADPLSVTSDFTDLASGTELSADELFREVYMGPPHATFQTCISREGKSSWGRLFVIAEPNARHQIRLRN